MADLTPDQIPAVIARLARLIAVVEHVPRHTCHYDMQPLPDGHWLKREDVLAALRAHQGEQPT